METHGFLFRNGNTFTKMQNRKFNMLANKNN